VQRLLSFKKNKLKKNQLFGGKEELIEIEITRVTKGRTINLQPRRAGKTSNIIEDSNTRICTRQGCNNIATLPETICHSIHCPVNNNHFKTTNSKQNFKTCGKCGHTKFLKCGIRDNCEDGWCQC